ncbi:MAG TPA: PAC2 family protein [Acidimicrobiia bacterium]|jgi:proteasome assembly chaperone (PAC2) family protein
MSGVDWSRRPELRHPTAILAFSGWGDAGEASTGAVEHLIASIEGEAFARIDPDDYFDFQTRRPEVELIDGNVRSLRWPRNEFHALHHEAGDVVALLGEEPQLHWKQFGDAVASVLEAVGVERVLLLGAFLGQVPHTVPVPVIGSSPDPGLLATHGVGTSQYEGPTGIVGVLTQLLAERGLTAMSMWAAVPHYLSNQVYPPAVYTLVRKSLPMLGLTIDTTDLASDAAEFRLNVDAAIKSNDELTEYVKKLESSVTAEAEERTTDPATDLVEEIERFLRET